MENLKKQLQKIDTLFKRYGVEDNLNASQELLDMYLGILNSDYTAYSDRLEGKIENLSVDFNDFLEEYTLEIGSVMTEILQEVAEIINGGDRELIQNKVSIIAKSIVEFLDDDKLTFLIAFTQTFQQEYKKLKSTMKPASEAMQMMEAVEENSILISLDTSKIEKLPEDNQFAIIAMFLQEVFMIMSIVSMQMMKDDENPDIISQEEYESKDFDIKEKMAEALRANRNTNQIIYEKADFAYSPTDKIVCNICHKFFAKNSIQRHIGSCSKKYVESRGGNKSSYLLKIYDKYMTDYFLHVLISEDAQLIHLDTFLRDIWLECCGHMSAFRQGHNELEMDDRAECLTHVKKTDYTYDFGSSTNLIIEFKKEFKGSQEHLIKLMARNGEIKADCHRCEKKQAKYICTECMYNGDEVIFCEDCVVLHTKKYHNDENYMISNFVNSPRTGVCAYGATELELE